MGILHTFDGLLRRLRLDRAIALKAASFAMIGVVNTGIDFGVFTFTHYYLGLPIIAANSIAWLMAVSNSYVMNSMITFAAETGRPALYLALTKPDVSFLVVMTTVAGYALGTQGPLDWLRMAHTVFGTTLIAAGTSALMT